MQVEKTNFTAVSTAATEVASLGIPFKGAWFTFVPSADCYIVFGRSDLPAASAANGYPLVAGVEYNWWINDTEETHFRVIRNAADGVITRYRSNL